MTTVTVPEVTEEPIESESVDEEPEPHEATEVPTHAPFSQFSNDRAPNEPPRHMVSAFEQRNSGMHLFDDSRHAPVQQRVQSTQDAFNTGQLAAMSTSRIENALAFLLDREAEREREVVERRRPKEFWEV